MLRSISCVLVLTLALAGSLSERALAAESHIYFDNQSDAAVWVTAYPGSICGGTVFGSGCAGTKDAVAWCVGPHSFDKHGIANSIYEVRAEVTKPGCHHPVMLDQKRGFPFANGKSSNTMTYYIHGSNGKYVFNNTP